ncbi:MAG TPA: glutaredoxin domain-containing protein [Bellilinea sp.]|nr:glutaredoxin domain-containing protein [Bellilinea sp.]
MSADTKKIVMYGTMWCGDTRRAKLVFKDLDIDFEFIDIDRDAAGRAYVQSVNNGNRSVPTILFPDGSIVVEPSSDELRDKLRNL